MARSRTVLMVLVCLSFLAVGYSNEKVGTKATCHNYKCQTEYGFFKSTAEWNKYRESCMCVAYFDDGPCKDMKCPDGYMAEEKENECLCSWPCDNLHCQGPFVAIPDYERKDPNTPCTCQLPPKNKCHEEL